jgi:hypothetical protein
LKLIFLIVTRAVSLLGLSRREAWWKDAEVLMLRHQLAVAERERPLKDAGIDTAPRRDGPGWPEFLRSQAQGILALDFFTADLLNGTKAYVLAVIGHGSRRVRILGATEHPVQSWVVQQARNLLMDLEDAGTRVKFVLHDRDASFTRAFDAVFQAAGIRVILWVPETASPHATCEYSWIRPPSRSRRRTWTLALGAGGCGCPAGGLCCSARCGR